MRPFTARRLVLAAFVPALFVLSVIPGCSNESEGERCGDDMGNVTDNDDCASGLVCTAFTLSDGTPTGRCCYTDHVTDSRCLMSNGISATGTPSGGASSSTSEAGAGGVSDAVTGGGGGGPMSMSTELAGAAGSN
jgi:hypothetical protein